MIDCKICRRCYRNVDAYNTHLNRRSHYRKVIQYDTLYRQYQGTQKWEEWLKIRNECDTPRSKETEKTEKTK